MFKLSWQQDASSGIIPPKICCLVICCNSVCLKLQGGSLKEVLNVCHLLPRLGAVSIHCEEEKAIESSVDGKNRNWWASLSSFLNNACVPYLHQCVS